MRELQDCVRDAVTELHARLGLLSYSQLVDVLSSLAVLLPLAQWPLRKDRLLPELAAALPAAAAALAPRMPWLLPKLRLGLGALKELAKAGEAAGAWPDAQEAVDAAAAYLAMDLYGSEKFLQRLGSADMAGLCAAVELAAVFDVDPGPSFVASACGRMSRLLAEATEAGVRAELDRAGGKPAGGAVPAPFDMDALEGALVAWCRANPQHAVPSDGWLQAHAAAVLRAYDPATAKRRWETLSRLARVEQDLAGLEAAPERHEELPPDQDSAAELEAKAEALWEKLMALGPVGSLGEDSVSSKTDSLPGPRRAEDLLALLSGLAARLGPRAGEEVGRLAEAALASRLEDMAPSQILAALVALAGLNHTPYATFVAGALCLLRPALHKLSSKDGTRLLAALWAFDFTPPAEARNGVPGAAELVSSVLATTDLQGVSSTDMVILVGCCHHWRVPFPDLAALEEAVERRALRELPPDVLSTLSARAQMMATETTLRAKIPTPAPELDGSLRSQLLFGVLLPLAALRQAFANPDMLELALGDWRDQGYPGLDASNATLVLNSFAFNRSWPLVPGFRRELLALMPAALAVPCASPRDLSRLLLAVGRSVRLIADKTQHSGEPNLAAAVAPATEAALLPALDRLMALRPSASHLGFAAQGLFVEARWRPTQLQPAADQPGPSAAAAGSDAPSRQLLARMLEAARASLAAGTGDAIGRQQPGDGSASGSVVVAVGRAACPQQPDGTASASDEETNKSSAVAAVGLVPLSCLLAACASLRHYPPEELAELYGAASVALRASGRKTKPDELTSLLSAFFVLENARGRAQEATEPSSTLQGAPAPQDAAHQAAREELLGALAVALLQERPMKALSGQPDALVAAVQKLLALGFRPGPTWLECYVSTVKDLAPKLSAMGLASVLESMPLLQTSSPAPELHAQSPRGPQAEGASRTTPEASLAGLAGVLGNLLLDPALSAKPDALVAAVRQLAVLGLRPEPTWLESYVSTVKDLAPKLSRTGLAYAAEGLALLRAAPPVVVLEVLLAQAEREDLRRFDVFPLGLLLGGVHTLWQNRLREEGQTGAQPLSGKALDVLHRATALFVSEDRREKVLPRYSQAQLLMVSGAVAALELQRSRERGGRVATADLLGRVEPEWLLECCTCLLHARKAGLQSEDQMLPPPQLIVDLLSLAALTRHESCEEPCEAAQGQAGGAAALASAAVSQYARLSLADLAGAYAQQGRKGGRAGEASARQAVPVSAAEWAMLLKAAAPTGGPVGEPVLSAYASGLFSGVVSCTAVYAAGTLNAKAAQATADYQAWGQLCDGISSVLLWALPRTPSPQQLSKLQTRLLDRPEALEAASVGQLACVVSYASAAGTQLVDRDWWRTLAVELRRRGPPPPVAEATAAAKYGGATRPGTKAAAAMKVARAEALQAWGGEYGSVRLCLDDLVAVLYGMEASGVGVGGRRLDDAEAWVRQLLEVSAETGAKASPAGAPPSEQQLLRALALLWTSRRLGRLECVPPRVWAVAFGHTGPAPWPQPAKALPAKQLGQLALLWAEVARAGNPAGLAGPSPDFAADLLPALEAAVRKEALTAQPTEAAAALLHLCEAGAGTAGRYPALVARATAGLGSEVPLVEVLPLLDRIPALTVRQLGPLVQRLIPVLGQQSSGALGIELARRVLLAAPPSDPSSIGAVLPLLQALLPNAEGELYCLAAQDRFAPAVLAAGVDAVEEATLHSDKPAAAAGAAAAGAVAAAAAKLKVEDVAKRLKRRAGDRLLPDAATRLQPEKLAPLVQGVLALSGGARLPAPAAAALLRLLSVPVVELLPTPALEQLVSQGFLDAALPMPEATAAALESRLALAASEAAEPLMQGLLRARLLRISGASSARSHAALLALQADPGAVERLGASEVVLALQELYDSGVVERVAPIQRHSGLLSAEDPNEPLSASPPQASAAVQPAQSARKLVLNGLSLVLEPSKTDSDSPSDRLKRKVDAALFMAEVDGGAEAVTTPPAALGPFSLLTLRLLQQLEALVGGRLKEDPLPRVDEAVAALELANELRARLPGVEGRRGFWSVTLEIANGAMALLQAVPVEPLMQGRNGAALAEPQGTGARRHPVLANGDENPPAPLLSARQLGMLFGLTLHGRNSANGLDRELAEERSKVGELYRSSLDRLAARTDLPPLAHLSAVLRALEPAVMSALADAVTEGIYDKELPIERWLAPPLLRVLSGEADGLYGPYGEGPYDLGDVDQAVFERELRTVRMKRTPNKTSEIPEMTLKSWLLGEAQQEMKDRSLLSSPVLLTTNLLLAGLRWERGPAWEEERDRSISRMSEPDGNGWPEQKWPNGRRKYRLSPHEWEASKNEVWLPDWLAPPPGRRHGDGSDPAGDGLREAYVRRVGAWLSPILGMLWMVQATRRLAPFGQQLRATRVRPVSGRWASLVAPLQRLGITGMEVLSLGLQVAQSGLTSMLGLTEERPRRPADAEPSMQRSVSSAASAVGGALGGLAGRLTKGLGQPQRGAGKGATAGAKAAGDSGREARVIHHPREPSRPAPASPPASSLAPPAQRPQTSAAAVGPAKAEAAEPTGSPKGAAVPVSTKGQARRQKRRLKDVGCEVQPAAAPKAAEELSAPAPAESTKAAPKAAQEAGQRGDGGIGRACRGISGAAATGPYVAGLRALVRCYAPAETRAHLSPGSNEMRELQDCVRDAVTELHARLGLLSYSQLVDVLSSLAVLLPLAQWPLRKDHLLPELAAALPAAAAALAPRMPWLLPKLRLGLGALKELAEAGEAAGAWPDAQEAVDAAAAYLAMDLYGSEKLLQRLGSADMSGLCAAVELAAVFDVDPGPTFVASACGRMSGLLAEATEAGVRAELDRAGGKPAGGAVPEPFDMDALEGALVAWCRANPQHAGPSDGWLQAHAAAVLRAYDPATADRRWEALSRLARVEQDLVGLEAAPAGQAGASQDWSGSAELEAVADALWEELRALGPVASLSEDSVSSKTASLSGPRRAEDLLALLSGLAARLGPRAGEEVGRLAEAALAAHLEDMAPSQILAALEALASLRAGSGKLVGNALRVLRPTLPKLSSQDAMGLLRALWTLDYTPPALGRNGVPSAGELVASFVASLHLPAASATELILLVVCCEHWRVPFPKLAELQDVVERRVVRELPPDVVRTLSAHAQAMAEGLPSAEATQPGSRDSGGGSPEDALRPVLLQGIVLPLATLQQHFTAPDMLAVALADGSDEGFPGLTVRSAAALLNAFMASRTWPLPPGLHKGLLALMPAALALPCDAPGQLSRLLLAVGRSVRLIADKMQRLKEPDLAAAVAPGTAAALLPALERLMALRPSASHLGLAFQGLFVEASHCPPDVLKDLYGATAAALKAGDRSAPAEGLLTSLRAIWVLERRLGSGGETPPAADHARSATHQEQLTTPSTSVGAARDELLEALAGMLLTATALPEELSLQPSTLSEVVEQLIGLGVSPQPVWLTAYAPAVQHVAATLAPARLLAAVHTLAAVHAAAVGRPGKAATAAASRALAQALTQEHVLEALSAKPDALVASVRQLAVLGLRPEPTWLESYVSTVKDLAPQLSRTGLAYAAEGLALLRAAPPVVVLEVLLAQAEREDLRRFDVFPLGLLLGGVHTLWQNRQREEGQTGAQPLSEQSFATLYRATALFVSEDRREKVLPRYSQAQLLMVSGAVAALELQRSRERGGRVAKADLLGRVEPEWLLECCTSLIQARKASGRAADLHEGARCDLLLNLLRLAFLALGSSQPETAEPSSASSATAVQFVLAVSQYVQVSLEDLGTGGSGAGSAGASERALVVREWAPLLEALTAAGMRPEDAALEAYTSALFEAAVATAAEGKAPLETGWSHADLEAWQQLCGGLSAMLLRALPWAPSAQQLSDLETGFLDRPTSLPSAGMGHLAAVCTYAAALGRRFAPREWWRALANELRRRGPPPPVAEAAAVAQHSRSGQLNAKAAVKAARDEAVTAWGAEYGSVRLCLDDLVAVLYGMEASGVGAGSRRLDDPEAWVRQLLDLTASAEGSTAAYPAGAPPSEQQLLRALALLWTARRLGRLECVPPRVWAVAFGHTGPAPWPQPAKALPAKQLGQLALLWAEVARAGNPAGLAGPSSEFGADLLAALEAAVRKEALAVQPAEAAAAVLHLCEAGAGTAGRYPVLVAKAVAGLGSELPLDDLLPFISIVSDLPVAVCKAVMASRLIELTPRGDPSSIEAVLPLLQALLPDAEAELYGMAAQDRFASSVLTAAVNAFEEATLRTDEPAGTKGAVAAAAIAAAAAKAKVEHVARRLKRRLGDRLQPDAVPGLSPQSIAAMIVGVLALNGDARLPAPAAAALLRLLSVPSVIELLPASVPSILVAKGFLEGGLPLPDSTAAALESRLVLDQSIKAGPLVQGLLRARLLRISGASSARSHAALLALQADPGAVERLETSEVVFVLRELYDSGVVERVSPIQEHLGLLYDDEDLPAEQVLAPTRAKGAAGSTSAGSAAANEDDRSPPSDSTAAEDDPFADVRAKMATLLREELAGSSAEAAALRPDPLGPFSLLTLRLLWRAAWLAGNGWCNIKGAAVVLQLALALRERLPGIEGRHLFWQSAQNMGDWAVMHATMQHEADVDGEAQLQGPDGPLWQLLDASHALCAGPGPGPGHASRAAPPVLPNGDEDLPPPLLRTRQLGFLFGLATLRSSFTGSGREGSCAKDLGQARAEVGELYRSSLDRLAARTDLPPLAHLSAVLRALEPAVLDTTQYEPGTLLPASLYEQDLPIERWLAPPILRILAGEADDVYNAYGEGPYGLGDDEARMERELRRRREDGTKTARPIDLMAPLQVAVDDRVLLRSHAEIDGELLAANLIRARVIQDMPELSSVMYEDSEGKNALAWPEQKWPNGRRKYRVSSYQTDAFWVDLYIPRWLAPPEGSRHGDGSDPAGDAAREAYARRVGAWVEAARSVVNMAYATGRQEQLHERLRASKGKRGRGRWALLFAAVKDDTVWGGPDAIVALGDELQATRKEVTSVLSRHVVLRTPTPQSAGSSDGANKGPRLTLKKKPKAKKQLVQKTGKGFGSASAVKQPSRVEPIQLAHAMSAMNKAEEMFSIATRATALARGHAGGEEEEAGDSPEQTSESSAGSQPGDKDGKLGSGDKGKGFGAAQAKGKAKRR
ncbi:hypothetical protein HYH03_000600 [Edaphochlamys debaryana]|uniref:Uncharacterized protein n=1 Tax=Edaphochlamys debaryana TaxID=47281 RepID=A0A836C7C5_9CHLO|nr:hypothetical protein HYH03_000600 [Edaphochlamys debaryana]|eukprot:KAG2502108.1 hypothetical protein HYH03_000600 [Edaphochlamys debaryana]